MKKLISFLLLSIMLLTTLVACGGDNNNGGSNNGGGGSTDGSDQYLDDVDFDGYVFRILHIDGSGAISTLDAEDADETSVVYQASVERDSEIMDRFNMEFEDVYSGSDKGITSYVIKDSLNPISSFDLGAIAGGKEQASDIVVMNLAEDASNMPIMDLTQEWYAQQANDEYNIFGKQFFFAGAYPYLPGSPNFLFNKTFILEENLTLPYDMMLSGDWTIEELMKYTTVGYSDHNAATPGIDGLDKFGYSGHSRSVCYFYQGFGGQTTYTKSDGSKAPVLSNDTVNAYYDKLLEFYNDKANWTNTNLTAGDSTSSHRVFYEGRSMFCYWITGTLSHEEIEGFDKGLGILPKYNLDQETYCCPVAGGTLMFPANLEDTYTTGYLYEAICEASWRLVYPASIQEAKDYQTLTDEESIEIKKLVDQSLTYDILKDCDPTSGALGSCGFMWECLNNEVPPALAAQAYEDMYNLLFEEFFAKVKQNIDK